MCIRDRTPPPLLAFGFQFRLSRPQKRRLKTNSWVLQGDSLFTHHWVLPLGPTADFAHRPHYRLGPPHLSRAYREFTAVATSLIPAVPTARPNFSLVGNLPRTFLPQTWRRKRDIFSTHMHPVVAIYGRNCHFRAHKPTGRLRRAPKAR